MARAHNFSAGPAVLPLDVLHELQAALPEFGSTGLGLMEMSHRSADFGEIIQSARDRLRRLLSIPDGYEVLFLQGGASLQFYMTALNLLGPEERADYLVTGVWSVKAVKEARRCSKPEAAWEPEGGDFRRVPSKGEFRTGANARYLHYTSNNTIYGTQFHETPETDIPLVADLSSDICSRPIDVSRHACIYAGAQKNLGPSGVTAVILSPWAIERSRENAAKREGGIPSMLSYGLMVDKGSMFNTPNTFGIFALDRMLGWIEGFGGLERVAEHNQRKAGLIYGAIDSTGFWTPYADGNCRSLMNITWKSPSVDLDKAFLAEAEKQGLKGLKGHRSVGGLRASVYNACPTESAEILAAFMGEFAQRHG
jgi:phosphoserine aminotransferase